MRIASLLASATEIVCALGLDDQLVAISHECDWPPRVLDRPRISQPRFDPAGMTGGDIDVAVRTAVAEYGSVYTLDPDGLRAAAPDLILTQDVCEVCAVPTSLAHEAASLLGGAPRILSLDTHNVGEILLCVHRVADAAGVPEQGQTLTARLGDRLQGVRHRMAGAGRPRVLALEWLDPVYVPGHWGPEMITIAGGDNLMGTAAERSRTATWEDLAGLDPDVLLVAPCGYDLAGARAEADRHAADLQRVAGRAIDAGRAWVMDASAYFNRSGPRVVDGVEMLADALHPDRATGVELSGRLEVWHPAAVGR